MRWIKKSPAFLLGFFIMSHRPELENLTQVRQAEISATFYIAPQEVAQLGQGSWAYFSSDN
jgi:hypothetical protein